MIRKAHITLAIVFVAIAFSGALAQTAFKFKELTRTGQVAPVPPEISFISTFAAGENAMAFVADRGLFVSSGSSYNLVVGLGDRGPAGSEFLSANTPSINSKSEIVFRGVVTAPGASGLFMVSDGRVRQLIADRSVATNGDVVFPTQPVIDNSSRVTFINSSTTRSGIFRLANGVISKLFARGDQAPGGGTFIRFTAVAANNGGDVAFIASFFPSPSSFVPVNGLFVSTGGTLSKIIAVGDIFPNGSDFFAFLGSHSINDAGQVAFAGTSNGFIGSSGVFLYSGGQLQVVVPEFSSLPGGSTLVSLFSPSINNAGQIAFFSQTLNEFRSGVFLFSQGAVSQIMAVGQTTPDGDSFTGAFRVQITSSGRVAFISRLLQHANGLFVSSGGEFARIAVQGDLVARTPRFLSPFAFGAGTDRVLVFTSTFPGGTGLFSIPLRGHEASLVARMGQSVGNDGVILGFFENFSMNRQGQVVFNSDLSAGISSIFLKSGDSLNQIVRASFFGGSDLAPDGSAFIGVRNSAISGDGKVAFSAFTFTQSGIYLFTNGQRTLAVDANTPVPGSTTPLGTVSVTALNDSGQIAFFAQPFPDPNGIFVSSNGQIAAIARDGESAPGGEVMSLSFPDSRLGPVMNNHGDVAFAADLSSGGRGVFLSAQGALIPIAVPGDPSPEGSTFIDADAPSINAAGQVAFAAATVDGGFGAYLFSNGQVLKVARSGDVGPKQKTFTFADLPQLNDLGMVAFGAGLPNSQAATILAEPVQPTSNEVQASAVAAHSDSSTIRVTADQMKEIKRELSDMHPQRGWQKPTKPHSYADPTR